MLIAALALLIASAFLAMVVLAVRAEMKTPMPPYDWDCE